MSLFIINTKATYIKNILLTDDTVKLSDEDYKTVEAFNAKLASEKKGFLDTIHIFTYTDILKIVPFKEELSIQIFFTENDKEKKTYLEFTTEEEYQNIVSTLVGKANLSKNTIEVKTKGWIKSTLYSLAAAFLTFGAYSSALKLESGENVAVSGSRRGLKRVLISISEFLGATNSLILGSIITGVFIFFALKSYKKSTVKQIVYN